jgi:hypothetical protein
MQSQKQNVKYQSLINTTLFLGLDSPTIFMFYQCLPTICYAKDDSMTMW